MGRTSQSGLPPRATPNATLLWTFTLAKVHMRPLETLDCKVEAGALYGTLPYNLTVRQGFSRVIAVMSARKTARPTRSIGGAKPRSIRTADWEPVIPSHTVVSHLEAPYSHSCWEESPRPRYQENRDAVPGLTANGELRVGLRSDAGRDRSFRTVLRAPGKGHPERPIGSWRGRFDRLAWAPRRRETWTLHARVRGLPWRRRAR